MVKSGFLVGLPRWLSGSRRDAANGLARSDAVTQPTWLPYLDGWRGISVIAVLIGHFAPIGMINTGRLGVEMFFCLSGRLMADILFLKRRSLNTFIWRRMSRVIPVLWIFVAVMAFFHHFLLRDTIPLFHVMGALTFTENYISIKYDHFEIFDHLWSLAVEEWAYLLLFSVSLTLGKNKKYVLVILIILIILSIANGLLRAFSYYDYYHVYWRTDVRISSIILPCLLFILLKKRKVLPFVPLFCALFGVIFNINRFPDPFKYTVGTFLLALSVSTLEFAPLWARKLLSNPLLRYVGLWSFSIYIWQQPFAKSDFAAMPVRLALTMAVAIASYYIVEQPTRRALNKWFEDR